MRIRRAMPSDLQDIASLHIESCKDAYSEVFPAGFLEHRLPENLKMHWSAIEIKDKDIVLIAEEETPIGFIAVWCRPYPFIDNLHVSPSHRSKKVGTALMVAAAEKLINRGNKTAYLWVFESNKKAIRFYERLGGVQKEKVKREVFGYEVLSRKIEWHDLASILDCISSETPTDSL
jgi:ribosomal protein S18 acetylase RimI-like enzyme